MVKGKRGNVEINNSSQARIEPGACRFNIQHSTEWAKEIYHYHSASCSTGKPDTISPYRWNKQKS